MLLPLLVPVAHLDADEDADDDDDEVESDGGPVLRPEVLHEAAQPHQLVSSPVTPGSSTRGGQA
jgi:hypothetical protein